MRAQCSTGSYIPFPKPKTNLEKCELWIKLCGRPQLNPSKIDRHRFVCSKHFVNGKPSPEYPNPVPAVPGGGGNAVRCLPSPRKGVRSDPEEASTDITGETAAESWVEDTTTEESAMVTDGDAKSDDPLSPDWDPSISSHTPVTKKIKRERDMEMHEQHSRMENKRVEKENQQDAVDVFLQLSSAPEVGPAPPAADDEQQCDNRPCQEKAERLQRECYKLREENQKLKDIIKSETFDELAFENDDERVKAMTGIPTYSKLQVVLTFVISFLQTDTNLSPFQQLLLTLMRLKMNLPLSLLGCIFRISTPAASRTFTNTIEVLNVRLVPALVFWPNREELQLSVPSVFRQVFRKCACIIDCFEILIEKPEDLGARAHTYSKYKDHHTMKYLIGITPQGTVFFTSKGWGGTTSDKQLTENSGFLDRLNPGDVILAGREFDVADSVGLYNADLEIPAFTKEEKQLCPVELELTRGLASVRIHVERVIGEAKSRYTILQSTVGIQMCEAEHPKGLSPLDKIVHVCCALTNLAPSVVPLG